MRALKTLRTLAALFALAPLVAVAQVDRIVVFGDSLSDTGNLATLLAASGQSLPSGVPFDGGRITNGPVAAERVAELLGFTLSPSFLQGNNYAVAGATARRTGDTTADAISLISQALQHVQSEGSLSPNALYLIIIGGNDLRAARGATLAGANTILVDTLREIRRTVRFLTLAGARKIVVSNVPDIGLIPETRLAAAALGLPSLPQIARNRTIAYNTGLAATITRLNRTLPSRIVLNNLFLDLYKIRGNGARLGISQINWPCLLDYDDDAVVFHPTCASGQNLDTFLFFDAIHPSARTHRIAGNRMYQRLPADFRN